MGRMFPKLLISLQQFFAFKFFFIRKNRPSLRMVSSKSVSEDAHGNKLKSSYKTLFEWKTANLAKLRARELASL